ncbi:MAG: A/G-specific adenine glycosylase [Anaerolineae bacterium]|nr:A/G-specific adenine glycosylase [Anaerolineae bacterium]
MAEVNLGLRSADRLLEWFGHHARDLPWRRERTPYRVWVAEVMLQQTRAETAGPYYERFIARFPTLESLARAPMEEVLRLWEGLGYYSRARLLHAAARQILEERNGHLPETREELERLPGVGPYIAGAVASIAFGRPEVALDGNAIRVLARLLALDGDLRRPTVRRRLEEAARAMMPPDRPGPFNEALMELGATLCRPRRPRCEACPLASDCQAHQWGQEESFPTRPPRRPLPHYEVTAAVIRDKEGRILLARRKENSFLGGLWEFPGGKRESGERLEDCLAREMREELGIEVAVGERLVTLEHGYTHFRITLHVFYCDLVAGVPQCLDCEEVRWVTLEEMAALPMPVTDRRIAEMLRRAP